MPGLCVRFSLYADSIYMLQLYLWFNSSLVCITKFFMVWTLESHNSK